MFGVNVIDRINEHELSCECEDFSCGGHLNFDLLVAKLYKKKFN